MSAWTVYVNIGRLTNTFKLVDQLVRLVGIGHMLMS